MTFPKDRYPAPNRRDFLRGSGALAGLSALGLTGCRMQPQHAAVTGTAPALPIYDRVPTLAPIRAHVDRIFKITVCTRPFRAAGPRIEAEHVGDKLVVHNYGHGGSGWSLSWGSSSAAIRKALVNGDREVAVVGCGALGLTSALLLQREGVKVTIYAKERPPYVRSSRATGSWTPDSRIALKSVMSPNFPAEWETMARTSWAMYSSYLGLEGNPVEWTDRYALSDIPSEQAHAAHEALDTQDFITLRGRIADLTPKAIDLPPGSHPFPVKYVSRSSNLLFNISDYQRRLVNDFQIAGGRIETCEFHSQNDYTTLKEKVIINCTGYAARDLWNDQSITPVRGQIAWLIPQEDVMYGVSYDTFSVLPRRDGMVVQYVPHGDSTGWNDGSEEPDRTEAEEGVKRLAALYARMKA